MWLNEGDFEIFGVPNMWNLQQLGILKLPRIFVIYQAQIYSDMFPTKTKVVIDSDVMEEAKVLIYTSSIFKCAQATVLQSCTSEMKLKPHNPCPQNTLSDTMEQKYAIQDCTELNS